MSSTRPTGRATAASNRSQSEAAAIGWAVERVGLASNPLAFAEQSVVDHPLVVVVALALLAAAATLADGDETGNHDAAATDDPTADRVGSPS